MEVLEERQGREAIPSDFPAGLRVLVVDHDPVSLKVLEVLLRFCNYRPTIARDAMTALRKLREEEDKFDLVISDVYMPDMDGFKLLELIGLEMDLPVIMLSASGKQETIMKGMTSGACDYLVKPVRIKDLNTIWKHVRKRNPGPRSSGSIGNAAAEKVQPTRGDAKRTRRYKWSKSHEGDGYGSDKENMSSDLPTQKKARVAWNSELHSKFEEAVRKLGIKRAVPTKILSLMNVDDVSRESVASHLQKYKLYLTRVEEEAEEKRSALADAYERLNIRMNKPGEGFRYHNHGHGMDRPSANAASWNPTNLLTRMDHPSARGVRGPGVHGGTGSLLFKDRVPGSSLLPGARRPWHSSSCSYAKMSNATRMRHAFGSGYSRGEPSYMSTLRCNLLEANKGIRSTGGGSSFAGRPNGGIRSTGNGSSFAGRPNGGIRSTGSGSSFAGKPNGGMFSAQSSRPLGLQPLVQRNAYGNTGSGNSWQAATKLPGLGHNYGRTTLGTSQVNTPNINQLTGQIPMSQDELQNQIAAFISNSASMADPHEQTAPFDNVAINNNTGSEEMLNGNFAINSNNNNASSVEMLGANFATRDNASLAEMLNGNFAVNNNNASSAEMLDGNFAINDNASSAEMLNGNFAVNNNTSSEEILDFEIDDASLVEMLNGIGNFEIDDNTDGNFETNDNASSVEMPNGNFAINDNTSLVEMLDGNFTFSAASSVGSAMSGLQMGTSAAPTQMLNGGVLPVQEQGANQEAVDGQLNSNNDDFIIGEDWEIGSISMDDILTVTDMLDEDLLMNDVNH